MGYSLFNIYKNPKIDETALEADRELPYNDKMILQEDTKPFDFSNDCQNNCQNDSVCELKSDSGQYQCFCTRDAQGKEQFKGKFCQLTVSQYDEY